MLYLLFVPIGDLTLWDIIEPAPRGYRVLEGYESSCLSNRELSNVVFRLFNAKKMRALSEYYCILCMKSLGRFGV